MRWMFALACVALVGCGSRPDPWGRRLTEAERVAWGRSCGSDYSHRTSSGITNYDYQRPVREMGDSTCSLEWDDKNNRLFQVWVRIAVGGVQTTPPTAEQIEPYIRLVEQLLPLEEQRVAREVASGPYRSSGTKNFAISGGMNSRGTMWDLSVALRWDR